MGKGLSPEPGPGPIITEGARCPAGRQDKPRRQWSRALILERLPEVKSQFRTICVTLGR